MRNGCRESRLMMNVHLTPPPSPSAAGKQEDVSGELPWRLSVEQRCQTTLGANETVSVGQVHFSSVPRACSPVRLSSYAPSIRRSLTDWSIEPTGRPCGIELYVWPSRPPPSQQIYSRRRRCGCSNSPTAASPAAAASGRAKSHHALSRTTLTFVLRCEVSSLSRDDDRILFHFLSNIYNLHILINNHCRRLYMHRVLKKVPLYYRL